MIAITFHIPPDEDNRTPFSKSLLLLPIGCEEHRGVPLDCSMLLHDRAVRAPMPRMLAAPDQLRTAASCRGQSFVRPKRI